MHAAPKNTHDTFVVQRARPLTGMYSNRMVIAQDLIGASVAARILDRSIKSIHRYREQGLLTEVGRLGSRTNSAVVFSRDEVEALAAKLNSQDEA